MCADDARGPAPATPGGDERFLTTDLTARCERFREALEVISEGDDDPGILALLAFAALHNQPPVDTAVEVRIAQLEAENRRLVEELDRADERVAAQVVTISELSEAREAAELERDLDAREFKQRESRLIEKLAEWERLAAEKNWGYVHDERYDRLAVELSKERAAREAAERALTTYGEHDRLCQHNRRYYGGPCVCGFSEAVEAAGSGGPGRGEAGTG